MICRNCQSAIGQRYSYTGPNAVRVIAVLCGECADALSTPPLTMDLRVERRADAERRDRRPRWTAKDLTGWVTDPSVA